MSEHMHNWIVVDWLEFNDTHRSFRGLTNFIPPTHSVNRSIALRLMCSGCEEIRTAQDFPNAQERNLNDSQEGNL